MRERERLIARIRSLRRAPQTSDPRPRVASTPDPSQETGGVIDDRLAGLEQRIAHLERLVEGLQDSVHRESMRHDKRLTELEAQIQPAALGAALSKDARERGL